MINGGIFAPKLSGKTTLAIHLSAKFWRDESRPTLVLDPYLHENVWGKNAWVTADEDVFWQAVWKKENCLVIVDEASSTIKRERELIPVFTRLRHNQHKLLVIGHSAVDLLPEMRQQLDEVYLFRQSKKAAAIWAEQFTDERVLDSANLNQYEFLHVKLFNPPVKKILTLPEKKR